ncbi:hypothetical protein FOQG_05624 [Fusarium oxysporum f. sp. raphani 54005]|uniref:Uncharacterized protein n=7 Tax=Fusarium oxysporum TaxID=5507 RepID=X0CNS8_FUSOX|nr:hypothetical protein FOXG_19804 [Fusarium oxysporum f. sp. lycopersici 4287]EWZ41684.1 hypothetical protein FOZG_06888 [Fusarium oxysporum Fo47]EXA01219.1 hypothetical protein FOWG_01158 [Fusarium oxysporum f. sp. lycopersici MN25]EXA48053.1 hypothetical protein FOVG_04937 [Fusarium oxysporum f. sp. pisi HDV247]EXK31899.1 hypothetical protein FOMG_12291 [Fusarium oxysporum f. sp. melonis 26406]EXK92499.1 hypothetical protein FOQG_05624 [Fusarium oxysporum f. sp. raphani 54005]EXL59900.1 hy
MHSYWRQEWIIMVFRLRAASKAVPHLKYQDYNCRFVMS